MAALRKMLLPSRFISWVEACTCSTIFSVKLNGIEQGYFKGTQDIRQGDPMSPYIFAIYMNI